MVNLLIGKKVGMTSLFDDKGRLVPVSVVELGPCTVTQVKHENTDGYSALQLGFGARKEKRTTKPMKGHFSKAGVAPASILREVRVSNPEDFQLGQVITTEVMADAKLVDVIGTSKGKGFAGVMKRHNFKGGRASHGFEWHRHPGSIGASAYPSRVVKGMRMAGHMGDVQRTTRNLRVFKVIPERNLMLIEGSIPGGKNGFVIVRRAKTF